MPMDSEQDLMREYVTTVRSEASTHKRTHSPMDIHGSASPNGGRKPAVVSNYPFPVQHKEVAYSGDREWQQWLGDMFDFMSIVNLIYTLLPLVGIPAVHPVTKDERFPVWSRIMMALNLFGLGSALAHTTSWFLYVEYGVFTTLFLTHFIFCLTPTWSVIFGLARLSRWSRSNLDGFNLDHVLSDVRVLCRHIPLSNKHIWTRVYRIGAMLLLMSLAWFTFMWSGLLGAYCHPEDHGKDNPPLAWNIWVFALTAINTLTFGAVTFSILAVWLLVSRVLLCLSHAFLDHFRAGRYGMKCALRLHFRLQHTINVASGLFQWLVVPVLVISMMNIILLFFVVLTQAGALDLPCIGYAFAEFVLGNVLHLSAFCWAVWQAASLSSQLRRALDVANGMFAMELLNHDSAFQEEKDGIVDCRYHVRCVEYDTKPADVSAACDPSLPLHASDDNAEVHVVSFDVSHVAVGADGQSRTVVRPPLGTPDEWRNFLLYLQARTTSAVVMFGVSVDLQLLYRMVGLAIPLALVTIQRSLDKTNAGR